MSQMTAGSLFSGIGAIELGFRRAGIRFLWHCEIDKQLRALLEKRTGERVYPDVRKIFDENPPKVDLLCGGDPCPKHSRARSNGCSIHPDMSGYFLAVAGRLQPRWLVRENVPAPTVDHFAVALEAIGYGVVVIRVDGASFTGQSRQRDIVVGHHQATRNSLLRMFSDCGNGSGPYTTRLGTRPIIPALTTHRTRYDSRDCYVLEKGRLRILDGDERDAFAGLPAGFTAGFSEAARAKYCGNAAVPAWFKWIGERIMREER